MMKSIIIIASVLVICLLIVASVIFCSNDDAASLELPLSASKESNEPKSETGNIVPPSPLLSDETSQTSETNNSGMQEQTTEANVSLSPSAETPVLVNEHDDEKGLIYLGLSLYELIGILDANDIGHGKMEDFGSYVIDFRWNDGDFLILFDEENDAVNGIEVSGPASVQATSTQKGLNIGDTYEKMVELYGDDYTMDTEQFINEIYTIYNYQLGDHYFEVWFQSDKIISWRIGN